MPEPKSTLQSQVQSPSPTFCVYARLHPSTETHAHSHRTNLPLSRCDSRRILFLALALPVLEIAYTVRAKIEIHSGR
jgi:hypothetical protein